MISPVGLEKDRVLAGFKKIGATILYLIQSVEKLDEEKRLADRVRNFAAELKEYLEKMMGDINIEEANVTDLKSSLAILRRIIDKELKNNATEIYINISTSSKIFAIASIYIAGLHPDLIIPFYVRTSNYLIQDFIEVLEDEKIYENPEKLIEELKKVKNNFENSGWTKGEFEIKLIPPLPFKKFTEFQKTIFKELLMNKHKIKLINIINKLKNPKITEQSLRSKLSYALRDLTDYGFIIKAREGREVMLKLTEMGEIFSSLIL